MPRKPKYTKEEIAEHSLEIIRKQGAQNLTARELAKDLGTTVAPIFVHYSSMEELKQDVRMLARNRFRDYIRKGLEEKIPLLGVGTRYVRFAREEAEMYRFLFLSDNVADAKESHYGMDEFICSQKMVQECVKDFYRLGDLQTKHFARNMWLVAHSMATLIVAGGGSYTEEEVGAIYVEFALSLCKAFKEVPGLAEGTFDKDEVFGQLLDREQPF